MGSVVIKSGIGYSERTGARYIDMEAVATVEDMIENRIKPTIPTEKLGAMPWAPWGSNNLLPMEMYKDIETCGILNSIIDIQSRFAINNGLVAVKTVLDKKSGQRIIESYVDDPEINDFLEGNNVNFQAQGWVLDLLGLGNGAGRYGLNRKKQPQIVTMQRDDMSEVRLARKNDQGIIRDVYLCAEWNLARGLDDKRLFSRPHLSFIAPDADLQKQVKAGRGREYAFTFRNPGWGKHYYSMPLWYAALKWVKIAQGVPEMKAAIFENVMHVKSVVVINEAYWGRAFPDWKKYTDKQKKEKKDKVYDDIEAFLVGSKNSYKTLFTDGYRDGNGNIVPDIEIKSIEDTMKDGKLLPDSAAANSEIAFAMHFNPSIFGGNQKAGLYQQESGGSSVREAGLMQVVMMELERQHVRRALYVPKKFNGWDKRIPGLDFIIPATVLTTLDTGAGTKPVVTGDGAKPDPNATVNNPE